MLSKFQTNLASENAPKFGMIAHRNFARVRPLNAIASTYSVVAHNYAFDSENKIHSDDVAAKYGFKGGLVPGVADFAYLARAVYDVWGQEWLGNGTMEAKFFKPIYHGESATAHAQVAAHGLALELMNADGVVCAAGQAALGVSEPLARFADYPAYVAPETEQRPAPSVSSFARGHQLGNYGYLYRTDEVNAATIERFVEVWSCADGLPVWHPAHALHDANRALRANVMLGPWIHTGSRLQLYGAPQDRELISLRGTVRDSYEKRGHIMTELDLAMFADERAIARIEHHAIIRLAGQA